MDAKDGIAIIETIRRSMREMYYETQRVFKHWFVF